MPEYSSDNNINARHLSNYYDFMQEFSSRKTRQADLVGAESGYGHSYCPSGIPIELAVCLLLGGFALAFGILYRAVTLKTAGRRKKRFDEDVNYFEEIQDHLSDLIWWGLEEFENKVDQIASGNDENSWIGQLYKKLSNDYAGANSTLLPDQMDGMEPPMLVETWGLQDIHTLFLNNTGPESSGFLNDSTRVMEDFNSFIQSNSIKSQLETNDDDLKYLSGDEKCNTKFWRCLGNVVKDGLHHLQEPGGITGAINKHLFNLAFHGSFGNVWGALMSIPEARHVKKCMNDKDECLSFEILRKEANATLAENPRMIVNPEFVESLDNSDGAEQFDPDDQIKYDEAMEDNEI